MASISRFEIPVFFGASLLVFFVTWRMPYVGLSGRTALLDNCVLYRESACEIQAVPPLIFTLASHTSVVDSTLLGNRLAGYISGVIVSARRCCAVQLAFCIFIRIFPV